MAKIKNMGASTVRFNEGVIVAGNAGQPSGTDSDYALVVSGNVSHEGTLKTEKIILANDSVNYSDIGSAVNSDCFIRFRENNDFPGIQIWNGGYNMLEFWQDWDQQGGAGNTQGAVIVNQGGNEIDFKVETVNKPYAIYADGTNDTVYLGGFPGTNNAGSDVSVYISGSYDKKLVINSEVVVTGAISFSGSESGLILTSPNGTMFALTVDDDGNLGTMQI